MENASEYGSLPSVRRDLWFRDVGRYLAGEPRQAATATFVTDDLYRTHREQERRQNKNGVPY